MNLEIREDQSPGLTGVMINDDLPSNRLEKLRGGLVGRHSIRVNRQWRLVFIWSGERGEVQDIDLDNHDYR